MNLNKLFIKYKVVSIIFRDFPTIQFHVFQRLFNFHSGKFVLYLFENFIFQNVESSRFYKSRIFFS